MFISQSVKAVVVAFLVLVAEGIAHYNGTLLMLMQALGLSPEVMLMLCMVPPVACVLLIYYGMWSDFLRWGGGCEAVEEGGTHHRSR